MSHLRLVIHSNNIVIPKVLKKMDKVLNKEDFFELLTLISPGLSADECKTIFEHIGKDGKVVTERFR